MKYKYLERGYCYPHISEHPNLLEAMNACKKESTCVMIFQKWMYRNDINIDTSIETFKKRWYFTCPDWAYVNFDTTQHTLLYALEKDADRVKEFVPEVSIKTGVKDDPTTKMIGSHVPFFTFGALVSILILRAVIRAVRRTSTFIKSFREIFNLLCIYLAGYMTLTESLRYVENKDTSSFGYKKFGETPLDKYPTFSICLHSSQQNFFEYLDLTLSDITGRSTKTFADYENILRGSMFYQN